MDFSSIFFFNYFWNKTYKNLPFIANGDVFRIVRIGRYQDLYGFRFVNVTAEFDEGVEIDVKILIDSFYTETSKDVEELNKKLRDSVLEDYADLKNKKERYKNFLDKAKTEREAVADFVARTLFKDKNKNFFQAIKDKNLYDEKDTTLRWIAIIKAELSEK